MDPATLAALIAFFVASQWDKERGQGGPGGGQRLAGGPAPAGPLRALLSDTWANAVGDVKDGMDAGWQRRRLVKSKAAADRLKQIEENWRKSGQSEKADQAAEQRRRYEEEVRRVVPDEPAVTRPDGADPESTDDPESPAGGPDAPQGPEPESPAGGPEPEDEPRPGDSARQPGEDATADEPEYYGPPPFVKVERIRPKHEEIETPTRPGLEAGPDLLDPLAESPDPEPEDESRPEDEPAEEWTPILTAVGGKTSRAIGPAGQEVTDGRVLTLPKEGAGMATHSVSPGGDKVHGRLDAPRSAPAAQPGPRAITATGEGTASAHIQFMEAYAESLRSGLANLEMIQAAMGQYGHGSDVLQAMAVIREHTQRTAHGYQQLAALLSEYSRIMREAKAATNNQAATNTTYYED